MLSKAFCPTKTSFLAMKLTGFIVLAAMLQLSARTTAQTVTYSAEKVPLTKVFDAISKQTGFVFFYDKQDLQASVPVTIQLKAAPIKDAVKSALTNQPLDFDIQGNTIVITKKENKINPEPVLTAKPPRTITGRIVNEEGEPVANVSVKIKGTQTGTTANSNGRFSILVPDDNVTLVFTATNIESFEEKVNGKTDFNLIATTKIKNMTEVVVNKGYYKVRQEYNTGNVTKVSGADIQKQPVTDPMMALEGRVAGLFITQGSGVPGANLTVQIRGRNSIASGNNPFYVVDGVPFTSSSITSPYFPGDALGKVGANTNYNTTGGMSPFGILNPADIESIEVLKDADATAIYGSRGANGVILITTKKGKAGVTRIDANVYSGIGQVARKIKLLNTQQYLQMRHEAFYNDSIAAPTLNLKPGQFDYDINGRWDSSRYTDWQKVLIGNSAHFTNAQVSLSGGSANTQFLLGGGYSRQTTVFAGDYNDQRASVHVSLNHSSTNQKLHIAFSAQFANDNNLLPNSDFTKQIILAPDAPSLYDANGNTNWENGTFTNNPIAMSLQKSRAITDNLIGNLNMSYEIMPGLQMRTTFGYSHMQMNQNSQLPATAFYGPQVVSGRINYFTTSNINTWIIEPQINYVKKIWHGRLELLVGTTFQENKQNSLGQIARGFASDALIPNVGAASSITIFGSNYTQYRYNAVFGRANYIVSDKYILNLTARRDGSSRFGLANQFGNFGSAGACWIFTKEKFIEKTFPFLSYGKIRGSYGITGNDQIGDYQYLSTYSNYSNTSYQGINGLYPTIIANPYFGWETVRKLEASLELGFFQDRILLFSSFYRNRTGNQLVGQTLPSMDGFTDIIQNLPATVQNTGLEFELNTIDLKSKNFNWNTSINLSLPHNKLISYPGLATSNNSATYAIGEPLSVQYRYHYLGVDPANGLYTVDDANKDGIVDYNDYQFVKPIIQKYFGGVLNSFAYKGFQFDVFFQFVKQTGTNYTSIFGQPGVSNLNQPLDVLKRWRKPGDITSVQRFSRGSQPAKGSQSNMMQSDHIVDDASFIRLKNLALSYSLPTKFMRTTHLQTARLYIQCQNLLTITGYKGTDPETQGLVLPPLRMLTVGLQVGL